VPIKQAHDVRPEVTTDDTSISIHGLRPNLKGHLGEWTAMRTAQLRHEDVLWGQYFAGSFCGWTFCDKSGPAPSVDALIAEVKLTPTWVSSG
jgi:hypothetical protein